MARLSPVALRGLFLLGATALVTAALIVWPLADRTRPVLDAFAAVPKPAAVLLRVDVARLVRDNGGLDWTRVESSLPSERSLAALCRFDPLQTLHQLVVVIPKRQTPPGEVDLGVVATGPIDAESVLACAERVLQARHRTPVRSRLDSFRSVRAREVGDMEVAVRDRGPLLVASGALLRDMIDVVEGRAPSVVGTNIHGELEALAGHPIAATADVDPRWFAEPTGGFDTHSALDQVRSASIAVDLDPSFELAFDLGCTSSKAAADLARVLKIWGESLGPALGTELGVRPEKSSIATRGRSVHATVTLSPKVAERVLSQVLGGDIPAPPSARHAAEEPPPEP